MGQIPAKNFPPPMPYGSSPASSVLMGATAPAQNPQQPLLPINFTDPGAMTNQQPAQNTGATKPRNNPFFGQGGGIYGRVIPNMIMLLALLLPSVLKATTTVTGHIANLGTGSVTSASFVRFWLRGCGGNQPRINGTGVIAPSQGGVFYFDMPADSSGNIAGTLYSTRDATGNSGGDIECGGSTTAVWYGMQVWLNGKAGPEVPIVAKNTATIDISNVTPISTNPVVVAPTGDSTYLRLDGGNAPLTGNISGPLVVNGTLNALCSGSGLYNSCYGPSALASNTTGASLTAIGNDSLNSNTTGQFNTAVGDHSLVSNTTANSNTAIGYYSGANITTGGQNTALGEGSMHYLIDGLDNACAGQEACFHNAAGGHGTGNSGIGWEILHSLTSGNYNTCNGMSCGTAITTGTSNSANGVQSLTNATTASYNAANGMYAGFGLTTGSYNVMSGYQALYTNSTTNYLVGEGYQALYNATGAQNTAVGTQALLSVTAGTNNTALGYQAGYGATGSNNTVIGGGSGFGANNGNGNTVVGAAAFNAVANTTANTAVGFSALAVNTNSFNTALGSNAGVTNTTGSSNLFLGESAGDSLPVTAANTAVMGSDTSAFNNFYLGKGYTDATPVDVTLHATGGSGTNIAGANIAIAGGRSTGNANGGGIFFQGSAPGSSGSTVNSLATVATISNTGVLSALQFVTTSNCSGISCGSASSGAVAITNPATTVTISTTAVTAKSRIFIQEDTTLGTELGVTCTAITGHTYAKTAVTPGTSFVITTNTTPAANSACLVWWFAD